MANVLITGCTSGFGLLTARTFARHGHQVFATVRDLSTAAELRAVRDAEDRQIAILQLDVRDPTSISAALRKKQTTTRSSSSSTRMSSELCGWCAQSHPRCEREAPARL
jgi:NAD(P)-dependent dehydrogenase (short-subunit alcohol dehydrogenase family)